MVAYTSPDCLPYFTGDDSPCLNTGAVCEPSTVWCDFATLVEAKLDELDATAEAAASPPLAWVQALTPFTVTINDGLETTVPFDTVTADTADMVDLDANDSGVTITKSGLYQVLGYIYGTFDTLAASGGEIDLVLAFVPAVTLYGAPSVTQLAADAIAPIDGAQVTVNIHCVVPLAAGQNIVAQINKSGVAGDFFIITQASLSATWMGDLP